MKYVSVILNLIFITLLFNSCVKDDFPVPPASTVSKFTYTIDNDSYAPAEVTFNNTSIVPAAVGDAYFKWTFGDGNSSTDKNPVHTFTSPGAYEVSLTVKTSISQEIKVFTETIVILNANASVIYTYFTD